MHVSKKFFSSLPPFAIVGLLSLLCGCQGLTSSNSSPTPPTGSLQSVNHIIFMAQENRGLDHYFGSMHTYWAANGFADQSFDGLPQFGSSSASTSMPANPGCDTAFAFPPSDCMIDSSSPQVQSFHMISACEENPSPFWNEAHLDFNFNNPTSTTPTLDGFVYSAAHDARNNVPPFADIAGQRTMSYYNGGDLPYYYFLASNFATSDRWFSPVMSRTQPNRMYMVAATSAGHVYPLTQGPLSNPTIFDLLQKAGISWKIYVTDLQYANPPVNDSSVTMFATAGLYPDHFFPVSQFQNDLDSNSLPAVAFIDPGFNSGRDEHPGEDDGEPGGSVQVGAQFVSTLINGLMKSSSWQDSIFILTYDEDGGFYDHVPPQAAASPDGIAPLDLQPNDICAGTTGGTCDFVYTGYRVPLMVVSPFAKKNYVSHTVADYTAWLKLVETRFNLPNLTKRDADQMDMTEFFDFANPPWKTPPTPPDQPTNAPCYLDHLP